MLKKKLIESEKMSIKGALDSFDSFLKVEFPIIDNVNVWANSPSFDLILLSNAYKKFNMAIPWKFYNERCVRTISYLKPDVKKNTNRQKGVAHSAIDDCIYQIEYLCETIKSLNIL